jgi:paraquat-inducible protein A
MAKRVTSLRLARPKDYTTPAVLVLSSALLVLGMYLPLLRIEKMLFWENRYSVVTGVFGLAEDGQYVLAIVVFFWSVIFPIAKLALLHWLWFGRTDAKQRSSVLRVLDKLGKWSMLDVFIVAVMVVALKLGPLAEVTIEPGFYYFGGAIIASMLIGARIEKLAREIGDPALDK